MLSLKIAKRQTIDNLKGYSPSAELDARLILTNILNLEMHELVTKADTLLDAKAEQKLREYTNRRRAGEPIAYILGQKEFMAEPFIVSPAVLIPRPETEQLVEQILQTQQNATVGLDLCTGSGAIAIMLLKKLGTLQMDASDISEAALQIAKQNAVRHKVEKRLRLIHANLFANDAFEKYDFIVSNPPYISKAELKDLDKNVKDYEPLLALDGGDDGLDFYRQITTEAERHLKTKGTLFLEIGAGQGEAVKEILSKKYFENIEVIKDLAGHERIVIGFKGADNVR